MTDYFALFQEPRRPWLDPGDLKQKFLSLSSQVHPDKVQTANEAEKNAAAKTFATLNAAFQCLSDPKSRLLHLLELESGARPVDIQQIPAGLADVFIEVATLCKEADHFLTEKNKTLSPLLQVRLFEQAQEWTGKLETLQKKLQKLRQQLDEELKSSDQVWTSGTDDDRHKMRSRLEELYRLFSYFNRWNSQVQERMVQMML